MATHVIEMPGAHNTLQLGAVTPAAVYGAVAPLIALTFVFAGRHLDPAFRGISPFDTPVNESPS